MLTDPVAPGSGRSRLGQRRRRLLQTRNAKRPAQAAVRFAVDAVSEGLLSRERALMTIDPGTLDALLHPTFDPAADYAVLATGVAASPARPRARSCSPPPTPSPRPVTGAT